jgi:hypothetical protein
MYENHEQQTGAQQAPPYPGAGGDPGYQTGPQADPGPRRAVERKSPVAAVILSSLPGLGQVYVGYYQRGFIHIAVAATVITLLNTRGLRELEPLLGVFLAFFWIYNMIDAGRCAAAVNRGAEAGMQPQLPELPAAVGGGSVFAGVLLVVVGLIILGRTVLGISLDWLASWWPLLLVVFGVRMIVNGRGR